MLPSEPRSAPLLRSDQCTDACRAVLLTLAAFAIGQAIQVRDGEYNDSGIAPEVAVYWGIRQIGAIYWVGFGLLTTLAALFLPRLPATKWSRWMPHVALAVLAVTVGVCFVQLLRSPISGWNDWSDDLIDTSERNLVLFKLGLGFAIAGATALLVYPCRWWEQLIAIAGIYLGIGLFAAATVGLAIVLSQRKHWVVPLMIVAVFHALLGVWMIRSSPSPSIDVFVFQQVGAQALLNRDNPYAVTYPDIYAGTKQAEDRDVYGKGLSQDGKLAFGFPYPPLSLLLSTAGYVVGGDYRYAQTIALTLAGVLIAFTQGGRWGALAALLLLFTPRAFFILGRGWTEPLVVFLLALTLFTATRFPRLLPIALGLFLASKQYLVFAMPLAWLLISDARDWRSAMKLIVGALLVTAIVSLPLTLWDLKAFWHSTVTVQQVSPFREDALSWLVWYFHKTGVKPDAWVAFAVAIPVLVLALILCPRTPSGFALGIGAVYLPFIAFNKQAFANYYLFVIGALVCALGTLRPMNEAGKVLPADQHRPKSAMPS